jgi:phage gp29-like protein
MTRRAPTGLYLPSGEFVAFAQGPTLGQPLATRRTALGQFGGLTWLPNPDPILKKMGKSIEVYRDLLSDAHVAGCVRRRKAAVRAMERGIERRSAGARTVKNIEAILADLPLARIIGEILDAVLYGYQPLEIVWERVGDFVVPGDVIGRPPEWFVYSRDNALLFRSQSCPMGEPLPPNSFLCARQEPTYFNPYGSPDLALVFWPTTFKRGGLGFWMQFAEKYGMPWPVGKYPRGTEPGEIDQLLDSLEQMVRDGVAAVPDDSSVEFLTHDQSQGADAYETLLLFCRSEVAIALLGQNQTTEVSANKASAEAGIMVTRDIRESDAEIVASTLSDLIRMVCDLNFHEPVPPVYALWEQEEIDETRAIRDKALHDAGVRPTNAYWMRAYGFKDGELAPEASPEEGGGAPVFAGIDRERFPDQAALDAAVDALAEGGALQAQAERLLAPLIQRIESAGGEAQLLGALAEAYPDMNPDQLVQTLTRLLFAASVAGRLAAEESLRDG